MELEGHQNLNVELAKQLLSKTDHKVELIVHRWVRLDSISWIFLNRLVKINENIDSNKTSNFHYHIIYIFVFYNDTRQRRSDNIRCLNHYRSSGYQLKELGIFMLISLATIIKTRNSVSDFFTKFLFTIAKILGLCWFMKIITDFQLLFIWNLWNDLDDFAAKRENRGNISRFHVLIKKLSEFIWGACHIIFEEIFQNLTHHKWATHALP